MGEILDGKGKVVMVACCPDQLPLSRASRASRRNWRRSFPASESSTNVSACRISPSRSQSPRTCSPRSRICDGLFASNETSSVGAAQAIKARKSKVKMVGFDASPTLIDDLKAGVIDALVAQHPFKMGFETVQAAVEKLNGGNPEKIRNLAARLVTRENLNEPEIQAQVNPDLKKYLGR